MSSAFASCRAGVIAFAAALSLSACARVAPYTTPQITTAAFSPSAVPAATDSAPGVVFGVSQRLVPADSLPADWWSLFANPKLETWIRIALAANPSVTRADATLRQAEALWRGQASANKAPVIDAAGGAQAQRFNPSALGQDAQPREFNLFSASVSARYRLDVAGGNHYALERLRGRADYQRFLADGARLTIVANVIGVAIRQAQVVARLASLDSARRLQDEQLDIARHRLRLGAASPDEHIVAEQVRAQTDVLIARQRVALGQSRHLLATLAGRTPSDSGVPLFTLDDFALPVEIPLLIPSVALQRRPDIQAADALMRTAHAEHGVAIARLYPQLTLSASLGSQALSAASLFGRGTAIWSLLSQFTLPLKNPALRGDRRAALAAFEASAASYQTVVLDAFRNVADALVAVEYAAQSLSAASRAEAAASSRLALVQRQYGLGAASYAQVLSAQRQTLDLHEAVVDAQVQRLIDVVSLFHAFSGAP